jgi:hypothetical protein
LGVEPYVDQPYYDIPDVAHGLLVACVKDKDGNILGFRQNPQ